MRLKVRMGDRLQVSVERRGAFLRSWMHERPAQVSSGRPVNPYDVHRLFLSVAIDLRGHICFILLQIVCLIYN